MYTDIGHQGKGENKNSSQSISPSLFQHEQN